MMKLIHKKLMVSLVAVALVLGLVGLGWLWLMWELGRFGDWGWESGYYGQYNRVKHVLEDMPSVQITNQWKHHDVTLEDFGFFLLVDNTNSVRVDFRENSPQMKERNKERIRAFIEEEIRKARTRPFSLSGTRGGLPQADG